jgi:hypothetical protein
VAAVAEAVANAWGNREPLSCVGDVVGAIGAIAELAFQNLEALLQRRVQVLDGSAATGLNPELSAQHLVLAAEPKAVAEHRVLDQMVAHSGR